jgi:uncharacterized membrane protein YedE/YeeE
MRIEYHPAIEGELTEIRNYYNKQSRNLGDDFINENLNHYLRSRTMFIIDVICGIIEAWCSWRFYICVGISVGVAIALHNTFPAQTWVWLISVPTVIAGIGFGIWWQIQADRS